MGVVCALIWASGVMVATLVLEASAKRRASSSLALPTNKGANMSRTVKDKPWQLKYPEIHPNFDTIKITNDSSYRIRYIQLPGVKRKKKRELNTDWHWLNTTPSWWTRLMMNRPQRRAGRIWEHKVLREVDLEDTDPPGVGHKPHQYYY